MQIKITRNMVIVKKARNKYLNVSFQVLEVHTAKALASHHWLGMCSYSVEEFLQMDHLDVRELDLVEALIRWGKFQLQNNNPCEDGQKLRAKILPGLRYIRFASLAKAEMKTCLQLLDGVLSDEEKHLISTKKWKQLPLAGFASASVARRIKPLILADHPGGGSDSLQIPCGAASGAENNQEAAEGGGVQGEGGNINGDEAGGEDDGDFGGGGMQDGDEPPFEMDDTEVRNILYGISGSFFTNVRLFNMLSGGDAHSSCSNGP